MIDLKIVSKEINEILNEKREKMRLSFIEDNHIYYMLDKNGDYRNDFVSVSKVIELFYKKFDDKAKALEMSNGDKYQQMVLLEKWAKSGLYSTNMGSRVHYILEKFLVEMYDNYKEVRQPIFECDITQINKGDNMVIAGKNFLDVMHQRGAVLLDTEIVLGSQDLNYVGQGDNAWVIFNKDKTEPCLCITDYKTNQPKNFEKQPYTGKMLYPFQNYDDTALSHYYIQLPLYGRLLLDMLKGTKYENIKILGYIVVLLKKDGHYVEYRIPKDVSDKVFELDIKELLNKKYGN
jgi:hypothetical protein